MEGELRNLVAVAELVLVGVLVNVQEGSCVVPADTHHTAVAVGLADSHSEVDSHRTVVGDWWPCQRLHSVLSSAPIAYGYCCWGG